MFRQSIFDQFFQPPVVVVVSEERLKKAEIEGKEGQLRALDQRIKELELYRGELAMEIEALNEPQSLEEALTGE